MIDKIRKNLRSQKGISLIEVVATIPIAALIMVLVTVAVINFLTTYEETKLYVQLQEELFHSIEIMRHGFLVEGFNESMPLIGLMSAQSVTIAPSGTSITVRPLVVDQGNVDNYKVKFYVTNQGQLMSTGQYNTFTYQPQRVFPTGNHMVGKDPRFEITSISFTEEDPVIDGEVKLLGIDVKAKVRYRTRGKNQTADEDVRMNTRTIRYTTTVLIGNA
jgi:hypothetical protein